MNTPNTKPPKRRRTRGLPRELVIQTVDGTETVNSPAEVFAGVLKESEDEVIASMKTLIMSYGENEAARVTACIKVLDLLEDSATAGNLREKLEPLRYHAVDALREEVNDGKVAAARANAGSYLLKIISKSAPETWPPDTTKQDWIDRMNKSTEMCSYVANIQS